MVFALVCEHARASIGCHALNTFQNIPQIPQHLSSESTAIIVGVACVVCVCGVYSGPDYLSLDPYLQHTCLYVLCLACV